jgi:hypothetical protein
MSHHDFGGKLNATLSSQVDPRASAGWPPPSATSGAGCRYCFMNADEFEEALHAAVGRPRSEMRTRTVGHIVTKELVKEPRAHRASWASANIRLALPPTIKVIVNLNLKQNSLSGTDHLRLTHLALVGLRRYWSRTITVNGIAFPVDVIGIHNTNNAIGVDLYIEKGSKYVRSYNFAIMRIDASFIYNEGYFTNPSNADADFMQTSAHEFGHSVLTEFGGIGHSWTHEGSTSFFQSTKKSTPGYPASGEIDLMKYFDESKGPAGFHRVMADSRASEFDVKCLLWMSTLIF